VNEELENIRMDTLPTCSDGLTEMVKNFHHNDPCVRPRSDLATTHIYSRSITTPLFYGTQDIELNGF
jgi:hypothetical protein